jgi:hypothetical protein
MECGRYAEAAIVYKVCEHKWILLSFSGESLIFYFVRLFN